MQGRGVGSGGFAWLALQACESPSQLLSSGCLNILLIRSKFHSLLKLVFSGSVRASWELALCEADEAPILLELHIAICTSDAGLWLPGGLLGLS